MVPHLFTGHRVSSSILHYGNEQLFLIKPWKFVHVLEPSHKNYYSTDKDLEEI